MKFTIERNIFAEAVAWVARSLPSRPTIPVLSGILITAKESCILLDVFDCEVSAQEELVADVIEDGSALVSGKLLAQISGSLPDAQIHIQSEGSYLEIICAKSRFMLPTMYESDFPMPPSLPRTVGSINTTDFSVAINQVIGSASKDDTLPMLTGVKIDFTPDTMVLAATDRFRLAVKRIPWNTEDADISQNIIIPARRLSEIAKSFPSQEKIVDISLPQQNNDSIFGFSCGKRKATSRLLDQQYLSYERLIPEVHNTVVNIKVSLLVEAIKRVSLVAFRGAIIKCEFSQDQVVISAGADEGGQAEETLAAQIYGPDLTIAFNAGYLIDGLQSLTSDTVCIGLGSPNKAVLLKDGPLEPVVISETDFELPNVDFIYLVMPTRIP